MNCLNCSKFLAYSFISSGFSCLILIQKIQTSNFRPNTGWFMPMILSSLSLVIFQERLNAKVSKKKSNSLIFFKVQIRCEWKIDEEMIKSHINNLQLVFSHEICHLQPKMTKVPFWVPLSVFFLFILLGKLKVLRDVSLVTHTYSVVSCTIEEKSHLEQDLYVFAFLGFILQPSSWLTKKSNNTFSLRSEFLWNT